MEFIHCNGCGHTPVFGGEQRNYFLTSCGHVFCAGCQSKIQDTCHACNAPCRCVQVCSNSKSDIKAYFTDPMEIFKQSMQQVIQVYQFQKTQTKSFVQVFGRLIDQQKCLTSEIESLKAENKELAARVEALQSREQSWIGNGVIRMSPSTPIENGFITHQMNSHNSHFDSIFGSGSSSRSGSIQNLHSRAQTPRSVTIQRTTPSTEPRVTRPIAATPGPVLMNRSLANRYSHSPAVSVSSITSNGSRGSCSSSNSTGFHRISQNQPKQSQQQRMSGTPDIMSRLKNLRW